MRAVRVFLLLAIWLYCAGPQGAQASETTQTPSGGQSEGVGQTAQGAQDAAGDLGLRRSLAERMNDIRPAREQIDSAIEQVARSGVPVDEQAGFILSLQRIIDYKTLEKASIEAMAETFTAAELKAMVEYYEKPEAQSAGEKFPDYQKKIEPLVYRMLDRAMMQMRTGSAPGSPR